MKRKNIKVWGVILSLFSVATSCNDIVTYNDNYDDGMTSYGPPVINGIYYTDDTGLTSPLTEANFGEFIMLKGENLSNVQSIMMNDIPVDLSEVYATATSVWLAVPSKAPETISNKIYYQTKLGETEYNFTVLVPDVNVIGLYNEMVPAGSEVKVVGSYFELHGFGTKETSRVTMNGQELEVSEVSDDGMTILIPADAQPNSTVDFEWNGVNGAKKVSIPYARRADLIFEDWSTSGNWGDAGFFITEPTGDDPIALCGPYFRVKRSFNAWDFVWVFGTGFDLKEDIANNPENYLLKFEVNSNTNNPFQDSGVNDGNGYSIVLGDDANKWEWNPSSEQAFNTYGEWCTIRLELADLVANSRPAPGWVNFKMLFQPVNAIDADQSFACFRIEKKCE